MSQIRFQPSFLDRLAENATGQVRRHEQGLSLDAMRERVAVDLEALLNTRSCVNADTLANFPHCRESIVAFGLSDFSSLSLVKPEDRAAICRTLEGAIANHEPRLQAVRVELAAESRDSKRLRFHIYAQLMLNELREPINFNATLHPVTQHYDVARL